MTVLLVSTLEDAGKLDFKTIVFGVLVIIIAVVVILDAIAKLCNYIGKPVKWIKKNDKDHETILALSTKVDEIEAKFDKRVYFMEKDFEEIKNAHISESLLNKDKIDQIGQNLADLKQMFVDDRVTRMRNLILNVAFMVNNNQIVSHEQYENAISVYDEYEKFLRAHDMTNGKVDISIKVIKKGYEELLEKEKQDATKGN